MDHSWCKQSAIGTICIGYVYYSQTCFSDHLY